MPMWRCPHCATPQAETARCWVCHRSSTACGSCRNFRRSVAAQLGFCGLDRQRRPLHGDEIRACWEAADAAGAALESLAGIGPVRPLEPGLARTGVQVLDFIEVQAPSVGEPAAHGPASRLFLDGSPGGEPRWSLWGDAET